MANNLISTTFLFILSSIIFMAKSQPFSTSLPPSTLRPERENNYVFDDERFNGSTLSVLGRNPVTSPVRELPVVGGTGVFRFASGYAEARTLFVNETNGDAIVEYNVYVLH
ncbi:hypothetical protein R6Q57_010441 [Mikania cordata]